MDIALFPWMQFVTAAGTRGPIDAVPRRLLAGADCNQPAMAHVG
jgi:hypothetical protein